MGAWGHKVFEDDTALDFMDDLMESSDPFAIIRQAIAVSATGKGAELGYDEAHAILVSAAVIRSAVDGTNLEEDEDPLWRIWRESLAGLSFSELYRPTTTALEAVLGPASELRELWEEAGEDYDLWLAEVQELLDWMIARP